MDWAVERNLFECWAAQIESLWGNGTAHLEKIRNPQSAVGYILKALGYMTKGQQKINKETGEVYNDQGIIKGNRYGISKDARAPDWECISEFEAAHMGQIVREVGEMICIASDKIRAKINSEKHLVLSCGHPSPLSANRGYWFGNEHFSKTNAFLKSIDKNEIAW